MWGLRRQPLEDKEDLGEALAKEQERRRAAELERELAETLYTTTFAEKESLRCKTSQTVDLMKAIMKEKGDRERQLIDDSELYKGQIYDLTSSLCEAKELYRQKEVELSRIVECLKSGVDPLRVISSTENHAAASPDVSGAHELVVSLKHDLVVADSRSKVLAKMLDAKSVEVLDLSSRLCAAEEEKEAMTKRIADLEHVYNEVVRRDAESVKANAISSSSPQTTKDSLFLESSTSAAVVLSLEDEIAARDQVIAELLTEKEMLTAQMLDLIKLSVAFTNRDSSELSCALLAIDLRPDCTSAISAGSPTLPGITDIVASVDDEPTPKKETTDNLSDALNSLRKFGQHINQLRENNSSAAVFFTEEIDAQSVVTLEGSNQLGASAMPLTITQQAIEQQHNLLSLESCSLTRTTAGTMTNEDGATLSSTPPSPPSPPSPSSPPPEHDSLRDALAMLRDFGAELKQLREADKGSQDEEDHIDEIETCTRNAQITRARADTGSSNSTSSDWPSIRTHARSPLVLMSELKNIVLSSLKRVSTSNTEGSAWTTAEDSQRGRVAAPEAYAQEDALTIESLKRENSVVFRLLGDVEELT